jgi:hypothetical protein
MVYVFTILLAVFIKNYTTSTYLPFNTTTSEHALSLPYVSKYEIIPIDTTDINVQDFETLKCSKKSLTNLTD